MVRRNADRPSRIAAAFKVGMVILTLGLGGCGGGDISDLQAYVDSVKGRSSGRVAPLPEFETYESFVYSAAELRDPFVPKEEESVIDTSRAASGLAPDLNRHKESLENFPLDTLKFVGLLQKEKQTWAIIKAPDNLVYRAQVGQYAGQNHGKISAISETRVELEEIIPDALGGWVKRNAALAIEE